LTVAAVAERLSLSEKTVRRLIGAELLPALRIGGSIRVDPDELEEWLTDKASAVGTGSSADHTSAAVGTGSSVETPAERDGTSGRREAVEPARLAGENR
jgi:excisionase family DNA binding protein